MAAGPDIVSSKRPSIDIVNYGDLTEFRGQQRCDPCTERNRKCIMTRDEQSCMLCHDAGRACVFERHVRLRGRANQFEWATLTTVKALFDADDFLTPFQNHNSPYGYAVADLPCKRARSLLRDSRQLSTVDCDRIFSLPALPSLQGLHCRAVRSKRVLSRWRRALLICSVVLAFYGVEQQHHTHIQGSGAPSRGAAPVACATVMTPPPSKRGRPTKRSRVLTHPQRSHAKKVRMIGACLSCRERRVMCTHVLANDVNVVLSTGEEVNITPLPNQPVVTSQTRPSTDIGIAMHAHLPNMSQSSAASNLATEDAASEIENEIDPTGWGPDADREGIRLPCFRMNCSMTFRGHHELRRHYERHHQAIRTVWICNDISEDKQMLAGCKSCDSRKEYNAKYNAIAHLRRHFNKVPDSTESEQKAARRDSPVTNTKDHQHNAFNESFSTESLIKWLISKEVRNEDRFRFVQPPADVGEVTRILNQ